MCPALHDGLLVARNRSEPRGKENEVKQKLEQLLVELNWLVMRVPLRDICQCREEQQAAQEDIWRGLADDVP